MNAFLTWLDDRTGYRELLNDALYESIPGGARWRYVWGSTLVFTFTVQVITGLFLWTAYSPSAQTAWESIYYIQYVMEMGWMVRGIHHFAAQAMVVLLALHLMQVVIDGAYRAPREVNFWLGLVLMQIVLALSLTGYLLPWDQKGYYATKVATNIMGVTPIVGETLQQLVQGGKEYGHFTLSRFFALHAGILPATLILFLVLHIYVFRRHSITVVRPDPERDTTFWPDQVLKDAVACLAVLATILLLATFKGAELGAPADPAEKYTAARPEWYFLFLFQFLKFEFVEHQGLVFGAIIVPGLIMTVIALMPIVGRWKVGHAFNVFFLIALMVGIGYLTGLAFYDDSLNEEHQLSLEAAWRDGHRAIALAQGYGIPAEGARGLLRTDPLTQGPKIFAQNCAGCHRFSGHDGTGKKLMMHGDGQPQEVPATAADLGNFGSREWIRALLSDYKNHFAPLANATWESENVGPAFLGDEAQMAGWSEAHKELLLKESNKPSFDALIEFIVAQGERGDIPPVNAELVAKGRQIFELGELADGAFETSCIDCHAITPVGEEKLLGTTGSAPLLTGYGGAKWLKPFVSNPGSDDYYGSSTNAMPAFHGKLSDTDFDLLVKWMTGDYYRPPADATAD